MSDAKKCDVCLNYFDFKDTESLAQDYMIVTINDGYELDLCAVCYDKLVLFLSKKKPLVRDTIVNKERDEAYMRKHFAEMEKRSVEDDLL